MTQEIAERESPFDTDREPWEKQRGESAAAFRAFQLYREMGYRRSLSNVARVIVEASPSRSEQGARTQLGQWSVKYRWVDRCDLYDLDLDRKRLTTREEMQARIDQEDYETATALLRRAHHTLGLMEDANLPVDPGQVPKWIEAAVRIRRLALGMATDHVKAALQITAADLGRVVNSIVAGAIEQGFVPEERQEEFVRWVLEEAG